MESGVDAGDLQRRGGTAEPCDEGAAAGCVGAGGPGQMTGQVARGDEVGEGVPGGGVDAVEGGGECLPYRLV